MNHAHRRRADFEPWRVLGAKELGLWTLLQKLRKPKTRTPRSLQKLAKRNLGDPDETEVRPDYANLDRLPRKRLSKERLNLRKMSPQKRNRKGEVIGHPPPPGASNQVPLAMAIAKREVPPVVEKNVLPLVLDDANNLVSRGLQEPRRPPRSESASHTPPKLQQK